MSAALSYVDEGLRTDEAVMVALPPATMDRFAPALGARAAEVVLVDLADVGRNPARIIPAWRQFLDKALDEGRSARGIGQPVWPERSAHALEEALLHEALLNAAFEDGPAWSLLCPYDTDITSTALRTSIEITHPYLTDDTTTWDSPAYEGSAHALVHHARPFPAPVGPLLQEIAFDAEGLRLVRAVVGEQAAQHGLELLEVQELVLAVHELATNSVQHGGGRGVVRMWAEEGSLVVEVSDRGHITQPLVGREPPTAGLGGGRGLWMVNQLCDLLQVRSTPEGTVARVRV